MKKYKTWSLITLTTSILLIFTILAGIYWGENISPNPGFAIWKLKKEWAGKHFNVDYAIIGSSRSQPLNPNEIKKKTGLEGINLSVQGGQVVYVYYELKEFLRHNKPKIVYIELVPLQLTDKTLDLRDAFGEYFIKWYADEQMVQEISKIMPEAKHYYKSLNRLMINYFPIVNLPTNLNYAMRGYNNAYITNTIISCKGCFIDGDIDKPFNERNKYSTQRTFQTIFDHRLSKISVYYFGKLLELIKENNLKVKFFLSPIPQVRLKYIGKNDLEYKNTSEILSQMQKLGLERQWILDDSYFIDPQHLGYKGSLVFNDYFAECTIKDKCDKYHTIPVSKLLNP